MVGAQRCQWFQHRYVAEVVREKVRPAALFQRDSAKKFAQRAKNPQISLHLGLLGEFFRENAAGVCLLGEFFRG